MKHLVKIIACAAVAIAPTLSQAEAYPERPVTIVVPFSAGGTTDVFTRALSDSMSKIMKQSVVVANKPGANGIVAGQYVAGANPDGYTLLMTIAGVFRQPHVTPMAFNPVKDLQFVAMTNEFELSVVVKNDAPWKNMRDLVNEAKSRPGEIFYGVPALMGTQDLSMIDLGSQEQIEWNAVPFKGDSESIVALARGDIQASITAGNVSQSLEQDNKVRVLASLNDKRSRSHPDIATWNEEGFSVTASTAAGISGPAGMPPEIVKKLDDVIREALQQPELIERAHSMGIMTRYMSSSEYTDYAAELYDSSRSLIAEALKTRQ